MRVKALVVYVLGVVTALLASGALHFVGSATELSGTLTRIDHAAIFFLIAATYTPVHVIQFNGWWRWGVLAIIWLAALSGMMLKTLFFGDIPKGVGLSLYLGLGWAGLFSVVALYRLVGFRPLTPLVVGALCYTSGAVLEFLDVPVIVPGVLGPHETFHILVLGGIASHWLYIRRVVISAPITDLYRL